MSYSAEVLKLAQSKLKDLGYYSGSIDGIPGPMTRKALFTYNHQNKTNFLADLLIESQDPKWLQIALKECEKRIEEWPGPTKNNPEILKYWESVDLKVAEDEVPWCSAFVNWCMKESRMSKTNSGLARSWLNWGVELDDPKRGCVVVLRRGSSPTQGHVGFFMYEESNTVLLLGGNQSNSVTIAPYNKNRLLSYRWSTK